MTAARGIALLIAALLLAGSAAFAEPPSARVVVLYVNANGQWDREVQEKWDAVGSVPLPPGMLLVPHSRMLKAEATASMTPAQLEALLKYPEMLLSATRRAQIFAVRYVVLDRYSKPDVGKTSPVVYDTTDGSRVVLSDVTEHDLKQSQEALGKSLQSGMTRMASSVWGHVPSKVYHVVSCDHVRQDQTIVVDSEQEALKNGYEACAICFMTEKDYRKRNSTEQTLGREVASYIERRYQVDTHAERQARVDRVGRKVVEANGLNAFNYTFRVLDLDEPNAFAAGAGAIYITRGLEKVTAGDDDMLGSVLGHEIGHTEQHHVLRQYRQNQTWAILGTIVTVATGAYWPGILSDFVGGLITRGNGRGFELEADRLGVVYAYNAGYNPEEFILVINALKKISTGRGAPNWLRTHPTEDKRLDRTRTLVAQLKELDRVAQSYATVDAGMAAYIRRRGQLFVDRSNELATAFSAYVAALGPAPTAEQDGPESRPEAPRGPEGNAGVGGPGSDGDTQVQPGAEQTRFIHD